MKPIIVAEGEARALNVIGTAITIRIHGRDTGGALSVVESVDHPGEGPPPHIHERESETFQVLEGEYEFMCGGERFTVQKGATIFAPSGQPHGYRCISRTAGRLSVAITPAGFEKFFEEVGALSAAEQEIPRVLEIATKYGLQFLPPQAA